MSPKKAVTPAPQFRPARRRAVGIIRVSEVAGRSGESFRSPGDQQALLERHCAARNYELVAVFEELDVSGYTLRQLHQRKRGLAPAVAMIECGEADVLLLPWLDRIARNLDLYRAVVKHVRAAGGTIEAVDFGEVTRGTAAQRFSAETLIHVAEFFAELTAEKTQEAKRKAIAEGIPTFDRIPFGYRKDPETRRLVVHAEEAAAVREAFQMRERGETLEAIRDFLRTKGCRYGIRGVQHLLQQRMYLGELRFGELVNLHSHQAIIDVGLFKTVQFMRVVKGPREGRSTHLLARLGIVKCAYCGHDMVVGSQVKYSRKDGTRALYQDYRCSTMGECSQRVSISTRVLDFAVTEYVKEADAQGHAAADDQIEDAERAYREAERDLNAAVRLLAKLQDLAATQEKLDELQAQRQDAYEHWQSLRTLRGTAGLRASDWDDLDLSQKRTLIRATVRRVVISRGVQGTHTEDRIAILPFEQ